MFRIVLVRPEIPPNTGNIIRLAANTGCELHLVGPLGFRMDDKLLRRAGLDYHEFADVRRHDDWAAYARTVSEDAWPRHYAFTTKGVQRPHEHAWKPADALVFGCETAGLPADVLNRFAPEQRMRLPMRPGQRSLNLSNAVAVAVFEAWRQNGYAGAA